MDSCAIVAQDARQLVQRLLRDASAPSNLIVCSSRYEFLYRLQYPPGQDPETQTELGGIHRMDDDLDLTTSTIQLIALSSTIQVAYAPTLQHLRAYLSTFGIRQQARKPDEDALKTKCPMLVIWGLINLHRTTSEYSAQELSRSLSLAVETAHSAKLCLLVAEPARGEQPEAQSSHDFWKEEIPLLNGNTRIEGDKRKLAGQALEIADVVRRWCTIIVD